MVISQIISWILGKQVINEDKKQLWPQYWTLVNPTRRLLRPTDVVPVISQSGCSADLRIIVSTLSISFPITSRYQRGSDVPLYRKPNTHVETGLKFVFCFCFLGCFESFIPDKMVAHPLPLWCLPRISFFYNFNVILLLFVLLFDIKT